MPQKPRPNFLGLVGGIVVQHQMDGKIGGNNTIDLIQEFAELDGAMVWPAPADHRSRSDVQGREKAGRAMAFVIVGATLNLTGQHRKDRLATAQRLNLTLLIHAQHQRMMGRVQVQVMETISTAFWALEECNSGKSLSTLNIADSAGNTRPECYAKHGHIVP